MSKKITEKTRLTRNDLSVLVYTKTDLTKEQAKNAVNAVFNCIEEALIKNQKIVISDFGTFEVHPRKGRTGYDPGTGSPLWIPDTVVPYFKAGKHLSGIVKSNVSFEDACKKGSN